MNDPFFSINPFPVEGSYLYVLCCVFLAVVCFVLCWYKRAGGLTERIGRTRRGQILKVVGGTSWHLRPSVPVVDARRPPCQLSSELPYPHVTLAPVTGAEEEGGAKGEGEKEGWRSHRPEKVTFQVFQGWFTHFRGLQQVCGEPAQGPDFEAAGKEPAGAWLVGRHQELHEAEGGDWKALCRRSSQALLCVWDEENRCCGRCHLIIIRSEFWQFIEWKSDYSGCWS